MDRFLTNHDLVGPSRPGGSRYRSPSPRHWRWYFWRSWAADRPVDSQPSACRPASCGLSESGRSGSTYDLNLRTISLWLGRTLFPELHCHCWTYSLDLESPQNPTYVRYKRRLIERTSPKIFILSAVCGMFRTRVGRYQKQTFTNSGSRIK